MSGTADDKADSMNKTLQEIPKWTRFANISRLRNLHETKLQRAN
jgi:hypothetical protein